LDPNVGVWDERDPMEYHDGANVYAYVSNRPLVQGDSNGLLGRNCMTQTTMLSAGPFDIDPDDPQEGPLGIIGCLIACARCTTATVTCLTPCFSPNPVIFVACEIRRNLACNAAIVSCERCAECIGDRPSRPSPSKPVDPAPAGPNDSADADCTRRCSTIYNDTSKWCERCPRVSVDQCINDRELGFIDCEEQCQRSDTAWKQYMCLMCATVRQRGCGTPAICRSNPWRRCTNVNDLPEGL